MNKSKITEEVEEALRGLVLLRTRYHSDDPALQLVDQFLAAPKPWDDAERRHRIETLFGRLWRVVEQERAL